MSLSLLLHSLIDVRRTQAMPLRIFCLYKSLNIFEHCCKITPQVFKMASQQSQDGSKLVVPPPRSSQLGEKKKKKKLIRQETIIESVPLSAIESGAVAGVGVSENSGGSILNRKSWFDLNTSDVEASLDEDEGGSSDAGGGGSFLKRGSSLRSHGGSSHGGQGDDGTDDMSPRNVDDLIFDSILRKNDDEACILAGEFLAALEKTGLRRTDQRLKELHQNLQKEQKLRGSDPTKHHGSMETLQLDRATFRRVVTDNIVLISRAFRQQFVIPDFGAFCEKIEKLYDQCKQLKGGKVSSHIPEHAWFPPLDPNEWGVSICTIDGQRFSAGDTTLPFSLQCCSKPITYAVALNELGSDVVHSFVGQEPSGQMFNEMILDYNKKPHNPMLNAGAIEVAALLRTLALRGKTSAAMFAHMQNYCARLCGGDYNGFNYPLYLSEREAADRNFALGYYMRENNCFPEGADLEDSVDFYLQCVSMDSNCESLAVIAGTFANGGICPTTSEKVLESDSVRDVLSVMHSCGMYDYAGKFAFKVGLPSCSSGCGAIMLVVPNVLGLVVWSPLLDSYRNSVKGVAFCESLVQIFNFHEYEHHPYLDEKKIDPKRHRNQTKGFNIVTLLFASASGDIQTIRRLHITGIDMNSADYDGRTALHLASAEGHMDCVEYLLMFCHVFHKPVDRWGYTPIEDAQRFGREAVVHLLQLWDERYKGGTCNYCPTDQLVNS